MRNLLVFHLEVDFGEEFTKNIDEISLESLLEFINLTKK